MIMKARTGCREIVTCIAENDCMPRHGDRIQMSSRIARPAYGSRQGSGETGEARADMAWYAVGLMAHKPELLADLGDRVVRPRKKEMPGS
jgi:hypothetical protein